MKLLSSVKNSNFVKYIRYNFFESDIERAVRKNEFLFHYQPEVDLKTGKVTGVEALIRWYHPQKGLIPPMEFIPLLERTGLIKKLTPFLFAQTLTDLGYLHKMGFKHLFMSVNLSIRQLQDPNLIPGIKASLKKNRVAASKLECEVTESAAITDLPADIKVLEKLNKMGVRLSLDDFGSGYSSFDYLRDLHIHKLKIDRDFISTIYDDPKNEIIVRSIIEMGHKLKLTVVAEGIETKDQEKWLIRNDCNVGQGFYFARPLPIGDLITFLKKK